MPPTGAQASGGVRQEILLPDPGEAAVADGKQPRAASRVSPGWSRGSTCAAGGDRAHGAFSGAFDETGGGGCGLGRSPVEGASTGWSC